MRGAVPGLTNPYPLSTSLPALYQGESFTERLLSTFDEALAPILSTLDAFDAYLDPGLTPSDFLPWLATWVGLELDQNWSEEQQRRLTAIAVELLQWRGTARGTSMVIQHFLGIDPDSIDIEDSGGVAWSLAPAGDIPGTDPPSLLVSVRVEDPTAVDLDRLRQLVSVSTPAHVVPGIEVVAT